MAELMWLIGRRFRSEHGSAVTLQLDLEEDTRRERLVMTWEVANTPTLDARRPSLPDLDSARALYLNAVAEQAGAQCIETIADDRLTRCIVVIPWPATRASEKEHGPASASSLTSSPDPAVSEPAVDARKRRKREELKAFFISSLPEDIQRLQQARAADDWEGVRRTAHQLKGCAASFGFPEITESAAALDDGVKQGETDSLDPLLQDLLQQLEQARQDR